MDFYPRGLKVRRQARHVLRGDHNVVNSKDMERRRADVVRERDRLAGGVKPGEEHRELPVEWVVL